MAMHPNVLRLTLDPKLTYSTHIHTISVQAHKPLQMIKALTATGWGKRKDTLMATYKAVMRQALEYASSMWSPHAFSTSINKLQVMQNAALRSATGCTQDTNIQHLHDETLILPIYEQLLLHTSQYKQKTQHPSHPLHKHTTYNTSRLKNTIFNNGRYTTHIPTDTHTITITDIKTNMRNIHPSIVSMHLAITKYCAHLYHTLAALKRFFLGSLVAPLPNSEQIDHPSLNYIYIKSTPNHIHHHYAPSVTLTHTTHIISSSTSPTYAPHCHPWICGQSPPEWLHCWSYGRRTGWWTTTGKIGLPPTSKGHGSGYTTTTTTNINKLQITQNIALKIATGCTTDTNIQHPTQPNPHITHKGTPPTTRITDNTKITTPHYITTQITL